MKQTEDIIKEAKILSIVWGPHLSFSAPTPCGPACPSRLTLYDTPLSFCPFSCVALPQPREDGLIIPTWQVRRLRLREVTCELSAALSLNLAGMGWESQPSRPQVCALNGSLETTLW